jgi:hypothetical protein
MKKKFFRLFAFVLCIVGCLNFTSCEKSEANDGSGVLGNASTNLSCSSSMPDGFQCIRSTGGATTTTTYKVPEIIGTWDSKGFDFCVNYLSNGTGVIKYKPSAFNAGSTQNVKWGAMVNSKGELLKSNVGTIYIVHESTSGTQIDPQIAALSFKQSTSQWYGFDLVSVSSCGGSGTTTSTTGQAMFWTGADQKCGAITVKVNGQSKSITSYSTSSAPACGTAGSATFDLPVGTYSYTAECSLYKWSGSITVISSSCSKIKFI